MINAAGALGRAIAEIRSQPPRLRDDKRLRVRRAMASADQLLDRLERLLLREVNVVPDAVLEQVQATRQAATVAGIRNPQLRVGHGVMLLMDDVYRLEEQLLRHSRREAGRTHRAMLASTA